MNIYAQGRNMAELPSNAYGKNMCFFENGNFLGNIMKYLDQFFNRIVFKAIVFKIWLDHIDYWNKFKSII